MSRAAVPSSVVSGSALLPSSSARIRPFDLLRPTDLDELRQHLDQGDASSAFLAGGLDLLNDLKGGRSVDRIIDLSMVRELSGLALGADGLQIGALVTHLEFERSSTVGAFCPGLADAWAEIGNVRVRAAGTLVGNVMARAPLYDVTAMLAALDAVMQDLAGNSYRIGSEFPDEGTLVVRIVIPALEWRAFRYLRASKPTTSAALAVRNGTGGAGLRARVALGCVAGPLPSIDLDLDAYRGSTVSEVRAHVAELLADAGIGSGSAVGVPEGLLVRMAAGLIARGVESVLAEEVR